MKAILLLCLVALAFTAEVAEVKAPVEVTPATPATETAEPKLTEEAKKWFHEKKAQLESAFEKRINLEVQLAVLKKTRDNAQVSLKSALKTLKSQSAQLKTLGKRLQVAFGALKGKASNLTKKALNTTTGQKAVELAGKLHNATHKAMESETAQKVANVTSGWASKAGAFLKRAANATKNAINSTVSHIKESETFQNALNKTKSALNTTTTFIKEKSAKAWELKDSLVNKVSEKAVVQTLIKNLRVQQEQTLEKIQAKIAELRETSASIKKLEQLVAAAKAKAHDLVKA